MAKRGTRDERKVGKHTLELSSVDKVMYPDDGITKGDVIDYYENIAPLMLQHIKDRPMTLRRWPAGIDKQGFFQKEVPEYYPDFILRVDVPHGKGEITPNAVLNSPEAIVYLANQNVLEFHHWCARRDKIRVPDKFIFDLDPHEGATWEMVRQGAFIVRDALAALDMPSYPMLTGGRGIHVVVPVKRLYDYEDIADWTQAFSNVLGAQHPKLFTNEFHKENRGDRVFLDWLRNQYAQTAVAPYSTRARKGAPVAVPVSWDEIESGVIRPKRKKPVPATPTLWNVYDSKELLARPDVWEGFSKSAVKLPKMEMARKAGA
jgi:bifunctional non-homologous end joining protein LigD